MTAQDSGRDLIGRPLEALPEPPAPALVIISTGAIPMAKAPKDGTYIDKDGNYFFIREGDALPKGAAMEDAEPDVVEAPIEEERAKPAAPENKAKAKAAPENRAQ
jgi:hypothetical protein